MKTGEDGMNDNLKNEIQKEAYETAVDYLPKLIKTAALVAGEFEGEEQEDTKDLFNQVVEGINWILDVYNHSDSTLYRGGGKRYQGRTGRENSKTEPCNLKTK